MARDALCTPHDRLFASGPVVPHRAGTHSPQVPFFLNEGIMNEDGQGVILNSEGPCAARNGYIVQMPLHMISFPGPMLELVPLIQKATAPVAPTVVEAPVDPKAKKGKGKKGSAPEVVQVAAPPPKVAPPPQGLIERTLVDVVTRAAHGRDVVKAQLAAAGFSFNWAEGKFTSQLSDDELLKVRLATHVQRKGRQGRVRHSSSVSDLLPFPSCPPWRCVPLSSSLIRGLSLAPPPPNASAHT